MKELVEYIAKSIVDQPDGVSVTEVRSGERVIITLKVAPGDVGKVIGKQGHIIQTIRTLLKVAAIKEGIKAVLEVS